MLNILLPFALLLPSEPCFGNTEHLHSLMGAIDVQGPTEAVCSLGFCTSSISPGQKHDAEE